MFEGALYPVRTDSFETLKKDLFFPTLINTALGVNQMFIKLFF